MGGGGGVGGSLYPSFGVYAPKKMWGCFSVSNCADQRPLHGLRVTDASIALKPNCALCSSSQCIFHHLAVRQLPSTPINFLAADQRAMRW